MRRAAKRDLSEKPIVRALRAAGALVLHLGVFDLLVYHRERLFMLDAKTGKEGPTVAQERLIQAGWPLRFVRDPIEALKAIGAVRG